MMKVPLTKSIDICEIHASRKEQAITSRSTRLNGVFGSDPLNDRVRHALVSTLYTSPLSLTLGALCGALACLYIAFSANNLPISIGTGVLTCVVILRIIVAYIFDATMRDGGSRNLELLYEAGAWAYALSLGCVTGLTIFFAADISLHVLAAANAIGYAAGISGRNAGRPTIAIGQTILTTTPLAIGLLLEGTASYIILACCIALFVVALVGITINTFAIIRDSFDAAEQNAKLAEKMRSYARTDIVTGLLNRAGLNGHLIKMFAQKGQSQNIGVFWLDLDRFKEVNDTLGHPVGDRLLVETAKRLRALCKDDIVARFGGDEFVVVIQNKDRRELQKIAQDILIELNRPIRLDGHRLTVSTSIGIAVMPDNGNDIDTIMQNADLALYHSKVSGRNQYSFFANAMNRDLMFRREIESELRDAIKNDELEVHYQPIVDLSNNEIKAFEALVRWNHPTKGNLSPADFIPIAEDTGLIITLGNLIIAKACAAAAKWPENISVCVNISPVQMKAPGASLGILRAVKEAGIRPERLELEITETVFIDEDEAITQFIDTLQIEGIRLALDDFGTGYSSLSYLQSYNFSKIKVDQSFVSGPSAGSKSDAIIRAVAELARTLKMEIVAEGIETPSHAATVIAAGCTQGQGYLYSKAMPADQATRLVASGTPLFSETASMAFG
jgi:diguanylate cyclase (GGDEF)-like protein